MQTLVAFALDDVDVPAERIEAGVARVERWYGARWATTPSSHRATEGGLGLQLWGDPDDRCRWPSWAEAPGRWVATLHAPLGADRLVGAADSAVAPLALADALRSRPADLQRLTPAFVLAELDRAAKRLTLCTDGLGLGRIYELETAEGRFWSNRPVAALRFAGLRAEADELAWARMAACDWAMGTATPYRGVTVVPAATRVDADQDGIRRRTGDVLADLVAGRRDPLGAESLRITTEALTDVARSVATLWSDAPVLSLSGGRDSRLVAAAFLAAGVPARLRTYGADAGEVETARRLVGLLREPVEHEVTVPAAQQPARRRKGAYARARQWHDVTEGLRPAPYLRSNAPRTLLRHDPPLICGVGGEFGHAPGYPEDVEQLERLPAGRRLDAFARSLQAKIVLPRGVTTDAEAAVDAQVRSVLQHAADRGVTDAKALDWFYADERLRRWGMAGESAGRVMPLLVPEFLSAAFGLSTAQSRGSALHEALIGRLMPQWARVDFYSASLRQRQQVRQQRLWEEADVDLLDAVVAQPADWGEAFDVGRVEAIWRRARSGQAAPRDELLLQRVVWRAAFTDHLAAVNDEPAPTRPRVCVSPGAGGPPTKAAARPPSRRRSLVVVAATWANDVPLARRLARTALGRRLRRALGA